MKLSHCSLMIREDEKNVIFTKIKKQKNYGRKESN